MLLQFISLGILIAVDGQANIACVQEITKETWKPLPHQHFSPKEAVNASYPEATEAAYDDIMEFTTDDSTFEEPGMAGEIFEANINTHFALPRDSPLRNKTIQNTINMFAKLAPNLFKELNGMNCSDMLHGDYLESLLGYGAFLEYGGYLNDTLKATLRSLEEHTNTVMDTCKSFEEMIGYNYTERLEEFPSDHKLFSSEGQVDKTYTLFTMSYGLMSILSNPNVRFPHRDRAIDYLASVLNYWDNYDFPAARDYKFKESEVFNQNSYVVTHIGFLISGQGRYPIKIADSPWLYEYLRENFYYAIEGDDVDLVSEFMDNLRQYGCNEENDQQMRDGISWLVDKYDNIPGGSWVDEKEEDLYDQIHTPWTVYGALKQHVPEDTGDAYYQNLLVILGKVEEKKKAELAELAKEEKEEKEEKNATDQTTEKKTT